MQERVHRTPIQDVNDLKQRLIAAWFGLQQSVIDQAIDQLAKTAAGLYESKWTVY